MISEGFTVHAEFPYSSHFCKFALFGIIERNTNMNKDLIDNFVKVYTPGTELTKPDKKLLEFADKMLPSEIGYLWQEYGFGDYGDGLIKVVDPRDYMHSLYSWLGTQDFKKMF